ncbi:MAG: STAS domain-containing protein [Streptosporangiaceae bacterium]
MTLLDVKVSDLGRYTLIAPRGELDVTNSSRFRDELLTAVGSARAAVIVDLSRLGFCDSSGMGVLVQGYKRAQERDIAYEVSGAHGRVATILDLTGLYEGLHVRADLNMAVQALSA